MKWTLTNQTENKRSYTNSDTGTICETELIYKDRVGDKWWGFTDLFSIPYIRTAYSKTISDLYQVGVTPDDLKTWIRKEKELLKSNDPEKYEKLYAMILEKESVIQTTVDPIKQHLALCTIYILADDERIDFYSTSFAADKLSKWGLDIDTQSFFLTWHAERMERYMQNLTNIGVIASRLNREVNNKTQS